MKISRSVLIPVLLVMLHASSSARAEDDALAGAARELFLKAAKAAEQQKWDQCRANMLAALAIKRHPQIAGNLGGCEMKLGLFRDAAEHITFMLSAPPKGLTPAGRVAAEANLREAQRKIGTLQVTVDVSGADVLIDGHSVGRSPLTRSIFVEPGDHVIEARPDGELPVRKEIEAAAGSVVEVALVTKPAPVAALAPPPAPPPPRAPPSRPPLWPAILSGSLGAVGIGAGIGLMVAANAKSSGAQAMLAEVGKSGCLARAATPDCRTLHGSAVDQGKLANGAVGGFVIGGAFGLTALGYGLWAGLAANGKVQKATVQVIPVVSPHDGGLTVLAVW